MLAQIRIGMMPRKQRIMMIVAALFEDSGFFGS
jgi:hypothetical protein